MAEVVISDLETGLKAVFRMMYLANCEIEGEEVTSEDQQTLDDLDSIETLENLKDLSQDLLNCKRDFRLTDKSELETRCQQFETMLQKLEADVRVHIRVEQQLKLHVEAAQARIEELQSGVGVRRVQELEDRLKTMEKELEAYRKGDTSERQAEHNFHHRIMSLDPVDPPKRRTPSSESSLQRLAEVADRRHKALLRLEREVATLRSALDLKSQELEDLRVKYDQMQRDPMRGPSQERLLEKLRLVMRPKVSPDRALTDRVSGKRREGERKGVNYSPYRVGDLGRGGKVEVSPVLPVGKALHHSRTISERISKASPSLRSLPKASLV